VLNYLKLHLTDEDSQSFNSESPFKMVEPVLRLSDSLRSSASAVREFLTPDNIGQIIEQHYHFERLSGSGTEDLSFSELFQKVVDQEAVCNSDDGIVFTFTVGGEDYVYRYEGKDQIEFSTLSIGDVGFVRTDHLIENIILSLLMNEPQPDREITLFSDARTAAASTKAVLGNLNPINSTLMKNFSVSLADGWQNGPMFIVLLDDSDPDIERPVVDQDMDDYIQTIMNNDGGGPLLVSHEGENKRIFAYIPKIYEGIFYEEVNSLAATLWYDLGTWSDGHGIFDMIDLILNDPSHQQFLGDVQSGGDWFIKWEIDEIGVYYYRISVNAASGNTATEVGSFINRVNYFLTSNPRTAIDVVSYDLDPSSVFFSDIAGHHFSSDYIPIRASLEGALPIAAVVKALQDQADAALDYSNLFDRILTGEGFSDALDKLLNNPNIGQDVKDELRLRGFNLYTSLEEKVISFLSFFSPSDDVVNDPEAVESYSGTHPIWALVNKFNLDWSNLWTAFVSWQQFRYAIGKATWIMLWNLTKSAIKLVRRLVAPLTLSKEVQRFRTFSIDETFEIPKMVEVKDVPLTYLREVLGIKENYYRFSTEFKVIEIIVSDETSTTATVTHLTYYRLSNFTGYTKAEKLLRVGANRIERSKGAFSRVSSADAYDNNFLFSIIATSMDHTAPDVPGWTHIWHPLNHLDNEVLGFGEPYYDNGTTPELKKMDYKVVATRRHYDASNFFFPYDLEYVLATADDGQIHPPYSDFALIYEPQVLYSSLNWNGFDILNMVDKNLTNSDIVDLFTAASVSISYNSNVNESKRMLASIFARVSSAQPSTLPRAIHHAWRLKTDEENMRSFANFGIAVASVVVAAIAVKAFMKMKRNLAIQLSLLEGQRLNEISKAAPDTAVLGAILRKQKKMRAIASIFGISTASIAGMSIPSVITLEDETFDLLARVDDKIGSPKEDVSLTK
jgi:hypothetical protein